jgi:Flp pilus assembly protein TadD
MFMLTWVLFLVMVAPQSEQRTAEEHYREGTAHFRNGQFDEALRQFEEVTRLAPSHAGAWKGLGRAQVAKGNFGQAEGPLRRSCELEPADEDSCFYLGVVRYALNRFEGAIEAYRKALRAAKSTGPVHVGLGRALEALGRDEEAERELREAIRRDDGSSSSEFDPRVELGAFLFRQGRLEEALRTLQLAVRARPDSARARFELARTLTQFGRLNDAADQLVGALNLDPNLGPAHLLLGKVYFRLGRSAEGQRHTEIGQKLISP